MKFRKFVFEELLHHFLFSHKMDAYDWKRYFPLYSS